MTTKELFIKTIENEMPKFTAVFNSLISDNLDYKNPADPKAKSVKELADGITCEAGTFHEFLTTGVINMDTVPWGSHTTMDSLISDCEKGLKGAIEAAKGLSEEDWESGEAVMKSSQFGEWKSTKMDMAWGWLFDLIHHRGQLSTNIRPMGGKVPSIYGPSADSMG